MSILPTVMLLYLLKHTSSLTFLINHLNIIAGGIIIEDIVIRSSTVRNAIFIIGSLWIIIWLYRIRMKNIKNRKRKEKIKMLYQRNISPIAIIGNSKTISVTVTYPKTEHCRIYIEHGSLKINYKPLSEIETVREDEETKTINQIFKICRFFENTITIVIGDCSMAEKDIIPINADREENNKE